MNFHHDPNATLIWFGNPMAPTASAETKEEAQKISEMWERLKVTEIRMSTRSCIRSSTFT